MTFAIVAREAGTGRLGVAAATGLVAIGALVPHLRGGVGAVATMGQTTNPFFGPAGLDRLAAGEAPDAAIDAMTGADPGRAERQVIAVDAQGRTAGWTGAANTQAMAHRGETGLAVAGNMLASGGVLEAMRTAFRAADGALADRLLAALAAAEAEGGDSRGACSAVLMVEGARGYPCVDLRADHHGAPVEELARLLAVHREAPMRGFMARLPRRG